MTSTTVSPVVTAARRTSRARRRREVARALMSSILVLIASQTARLSRTSGARTRPASSPLLSGYSPRRRLACCSAGDDLVIDEMLPTPDLLPVWMDALADLDVLLVAVTCPLEVAEQREAARGTEPGLARGHLRTVHTHVTTYDLTLDTTRATPTALAKAILRHHQTRS
ncbi:hypothetical protein AB0M95_09735 [Sphaerisporangium sp. NPDC051017]|uniref:phosphotransferase-like protein n=1 Tax=Sphaerisporangium sp. NPDC051017 TaxID=3154636 RepID=UPI003440F031